MKVLNDRRKQRKKKTNDLVIPRCKLFTAAGKVFSRDLHSKVAVNRVQSCEKYVARWNVSGYCVGTF